MKLYDIIAIADHDYRGFRYKNIRFLIHRVGTRSWDIEQEQLCTNQSSLEWVERHLFTAEEAADIKRNLDRVGGFNEIRIEEVALPVEGFLMAADALGYEIGQDSWLLAKDPDWDGPEVKAYFTIRGMEPVNPFEVLEPRLDKIEALLREVRQGAVS